jgi:peptide chain release factor 1
VAPTSQVRAKYLTLYKLDDIMQGGLEQVIQPLIREHQAELLTQLGDD